MVSSAQQTEKGPKTFSTWAPVSYEGMRPRVATLDHLAAYNSIDVPLTGRGEPVQLPALEVSPNFFATLGVDPAQGRSGDRGTVHQHRWPSAHCRRRAAGGLHLQAGAATPGSAAGS